MTCIVCYKEDYGITVGVDSSALNENIKFDVGNVKIIRDKENNFLIGYTTSFRGGQLLLNNLKIPPIESFNGDVL